MFKIKSAPKDMSEQTWIELYLYYTRISNNEQFKLPEKRSGLKRIGFSEEEVDQMCEPRKFTDEEKEQMLNNAIDQGIKDAKAYQRGVEKAEREKKAWALYRNY